ncbi:hypothetical protein PoB_006007400 [Plakobranchus ocellatus]|uniref:C1q domain-containing protein n=1 Tax=Plakobranchus ocellatus TaxID=259542 RepID=A0AAV4CNY6_9GAST|nr:hypothetical protein PoB_006007400 [Plakobranchus ocellatus]
MIRQTDREGSDDRITVVQTESMLQNTPSNRTEVVGNVPSPDSEDKSISLTVTLLEPVEEDSGSYECQVLYMSTDTQLKNFIAAATLNVTAVPPPNYIPEMPDTCECDAIWGEIDNIKATLASGSSSGPAPAAASECQVSFAAHFSSRSGNSIFSGQTAVFDSASSNKGDAYDVSTGEFTAPCDGQVR